MVQIYHFPKLCTLILVNKGVKMVPYLHPHVRAGNGFKVLSTPVHTFVLPFCTLFRRSDQYHANNTSAGWLSDPFNHLFGRRITIFVGAIFSLLAPFGMATSQHWGQLAVCRGLLGIGTYTVHLLRCLNLTTVKAWV